MPAPPPSPFPALIRQILQHTSPLPAESDAPIRHYKRAANDAMNLLAYVERNLNRTKVYQLPRDRHMHRLQAMVLLSLIEAFERFLKELIAICIDYVSPLVLDDRLKVFKIDGDDLLAHFQERSLGKSLSEASTWLDCGLINERFRKVLAEPFDQGKPFNLFPPQRDPDSWRFETLNVLWQIRHTLVHNLGVVTQSDAARFRVLVRQPVSSRVVLWPEKDDVRNVKVFLDDNTGWVSDRVAQRLGELLTTIDPQDTQLLDPGGAAQELADRLQRAVTISSVSKSPSV